MTASDEEIYFWMVKPLRGLKLPSPDLIYNFFGLLIFTKPQGLMSGFNFIYTLQILHHFHFISNPISTLFFVLFSSTWLLSLSWIFTIFPACEARLGHCIFVH